MIVGSLDSSRVVGINCAPVYVPVIFARDLMKPKETFFDVGSDTDVPTRICDARLLHVRVYLSDDTARILSLHWHSPNYT
jgi:hypothetical protein